MTRLLALALLFVVSSALSGCGIKGDLDRPPPLWGETEKTEAVEVTQTAEPVDDNTVLPTPDDEDDEDIGYGVGVAD